MPDTCAVPVHVRINVVYAYICGGGLNGAKGVKVDFNFIVLLKEHARYN